MGCSIDRTYHMQCMLCICVGRRNNPQYMYVQLLPWAILGLQFLVQNQRQGL